MVIFLEVVPFCEKFMSSTMILQSNSHGAEATRVKVGGHRQRNQELYETVQKDTQFAFFT